MNTRWLWLAAGCAAALLAQDAVTEWADRFAQWTATRNLDAPARNAVHLRHQATVTNARVAQATLWTVPAGRRLALEQLAVYCVYPNIPAGRLDQAHMATVVNGTVARYPLVRNYNNAVNDILAGPLRMYADPETPVQVTLGFTDFANAVCEITATGHTAQLAP